MDEVIIHECSFCSSSAVVPWLAKICMFNNKTFAFIWISLRSCYIAGPPASAYCPSDLYVTDVTSSSAVLHWRNNGPRRTARRTVDCEVCAIY